MAYGVYLNKIDASTLTVGGKITAIGNEARGFNTSSLNGATVTFESVAVTGGNTSGSLGYGLDINSINNSTVTVNETITAEGNDAVGFRSSVKDGGGGLSNNAKVELGDITATGTGEDNSATGLDIDTIYSSTLTAQNITAEGNVASGFYSLGGLSNDAKVTLGDVKATGTNSGYGLGIGNIYSSTLTAQNITAKGNVAIGFSSENISTDAEVTAEVTLGDVEATGTNSGDGLSIISIDSGTVTAGKINVMGDNATGLTAWEVKGGAKVELQGNVTVTGSNVQGNPDVPNAANGLFFGIINEASTLTAKDVTVTGYNAAGFLVGAFEDDFFNPEFKNAEVTLGNVNVTGDNEAYGLRLFVGIDAGKLTAGNINAKGNNATGFWSSNISGAETVVTLGDVEATGTGEDSWAEGLSIESIDSGTVTAENIIVQGNEAFGFSSWGDISNNVKVKLGNVTATGGNNEGNRASGLSIMGNIIDTGIVTAGNIIVQGNDARGFYSSDILTGAKVTLGDIDATSVGDYNYACGLYLDNIDSGTVTAGNINVTGNVVRGFSSWGNISNNAKVELGNVNVESYGDSGDPDNYDYGIEVFGNITAGSSLKVNNVTVQSTGTNANAYGVRIGGSIDNDTNVTLGTVCAESNNNAYGIVIGGEEDVIPTGSSTLTVTKDVLAITNANPNTNANAEAVGIMFIGNENNPSLALTIDTTNDDVQISGTANSAKSKSIVMNGFNNNDSLLITGTNNHTNRSQVFVTDGAENVRWKTNANYVTGSRFTTNAETTHQIATGKTVMIDGYGLAVEGADYTFGSADDNNSAGTLDVQRFTAGNVTVNNGTLAIDGRMGIQGMPSEIGTLTIGNDNPDAQESAIVAIYGEAPVGTVALKLNGEPTLHGNAVTDQRTNEKVLSLTKFTDYRLNSTATAYVAQNRSRIDLADGFLLPVSIHYRLTAWETVHDHVISGGQQGNANNNNNKGILGQVSRKDVTCDPCDPCAANQKWSGKRNAWVNYVGRANNYRSSYNNPGIANWDINTNGVQVGLDLYKTNKKQFGVLFGYEDANATLRSDRLDADDVYVGGYAAHVFRNGADLLAVYNYGSQDYKLKRLDSTLAFDQHYHNSKFNGNTHEVNLEIGKRFFTNSCYAVAVLQCEDWFILFKNFYCRIVPNLVNYAFPSVRFPEI